MSIGAAVRGIFCGIFAALMRHYTGAQEAPRQSA